MEILPVIITYTIVTAIGLVSMFMALKDKKRPITLSGFHALFTLVGFAVFTWYMVSEVPMGIFSWPRISYLLYGIAGTVTFIAIFLNKLLSMKLPKWLPASYGIFEVLGYAALWAAAIVFY